MKKAAIFSLITGLPLIVVVDYIMDVTHQWLVPGTIFPFRLLGFVTVETIIWAIFSVYSVVMFYEYFLESYRETCIWHPRMKVLTAILLGFLVIFFAVYSFYPSFLSTIPYAYLLLGTITVFIPTVIGLFRHPNLLPKFLVVGAYFFYLDLVYEITALKLGWWIFPSAQYIGLVSIFGVTFPIEELVFWMLFLAVGTLSYYELFDDDKR